MITENINGLIRLIAEGNNKITNKKRSFFSDFIYLGNNDSVSNYEEVGREIWKNFIQDNSTDFDILNEDMTNINNSVFNLEEVTLNVDFRVMIIEMELEYGSKPNMNLAFIRSTKLGGDKVYNLLKKKIERKTYDSKDEMMQMLDLYFFNNRITAEEYSELISLLNAQDK